MTNTTVPDEVLKIDVLGSWKLGVSVHFLAFCGPVAAFCSFFIRFTRLALALRQAIRSD
jgi:hypothetical protein